MTIDSIFEAIAKFFDWRKVVDSPETIRLKKILEIDNELVSLRKKRDELLLEVINDENEEEMAVALGVIINRIIELRRNRKGYQR